MTDHMAKLILAMRQERDMTQGEFGAFVGSHQATVSKWENGENVARSKALGRVALACGVYADDLFKFISDPRTPLRRVEPGSPQPSSAILSILGSPYPVNSVPPSPK